MAKRIPQLDGLRALAILAVFVGHSLKVRMMWMGVDLFFVLSGFLITSILLDVPKVSFTSYIGAFYARRVRRILPPFLLLLVVVSVVFGVAWLKHWYMYFGLMNYREFFHDEILTGPLASLWSLGVEEQFYFFWPVLVYFVAPKKLPGILLGLMILAPVLRGVLTPWAEHQAWNQYHWFFYRGTPFRMDTLAAGSLVAVLWRTHTEKIKRVGAWGLVPIVLLPGTMILLNRMFGGMSTIDGTVRGNVFTYELALIAMVGVLLWALGGRFTRVLTLKPMLWLARISYSFYLIHEGVLDLANNHLKNEFAIAVVAFTATVAYAELSWLLMERPILHGGNRKEAKLELEAAQPKPLE